MPHGTLLQSRTLKGLGPASLVPSSVATARSTDGSFGYSQPTGVGIEDVFVSGSWAYRQVNGKVV